ANELRTQLFERMTEFMGLYDYLLCPTVQTPPFDIDVPYLESINDVKFDTYVDWMKSCYLITVTGLPALSMPAGFTENGLPVGIQLVGGYHADRAVLDFAHEVESILQFASRAPVL
ncbi:MAG TPA: amidase, partial [Planctomycetaceae bacterium]|nr:amidase [Planctomycetaceae bacterium]